MTDPAIPPVLATVSIDLFLDGRRADACGFRDGLRRLPALDLPHDPLSTVRRRSGILLLRSEPDGQPTESLEKRSREGPMDVGAWLHDLGLGQYEQAFRE